MEQFKDGYLEIKKPRTETGNTPKIVNGRVVYKVVRLPLAAKKQIDRENLTLPDGMKMTYREVFPNRYEGPSPEEIKQMELETENESLKKQLAAFKAQQEEAKLAEKTPAAPAPKVDDVLGSKASVKTKTDGKE